MFRSHFYKATGLLTFVFAVCLAFTTQESVAQEKSARFESLQLHALSAREGKGTSGEGERGLERYTNGARGLPQPKDLILPELDAERSLYITDPDLVKIPLSSVMNSLARQIEAVSDGYSMDGTALFQDWWKSAASKKENDLGDHPGCEDFWLEELNPAEYDCNTAEAKLRYVKDLDASFQLISIVNRGDLSDINDEQTETCGEYRLVFEDTLKTLPSLIAANDNVNASANDTVKLFLSFEFEIPNAYRHDKRNPMCLAIQRFFYSLSYEITDKGKIAALLRRFFLDDTVWMTPDGLFTDQTDPTAVTFGPIVSPWNLGMPHVIARPDHIGIGHPLGRIATNTNVGGSDWRFRAYQFRKTDIGKSENRVRILPAALPGSLNLVPLRKSKLADECLTVKDVIMPLRPNSKVPSTMTSNLIDHLGSEIHPCFRSLEMKLTGTNQSSFRGDHYAYKPDKSYAMRKLAELATKDNYDAVIANAHLMSCSGCHGGLFSNELSHLKSAIAQDALVTLIGKELRLAQFVHSNAMNTPLENEGSAKSLALEVFFLPWRKAVMITFLRNDFDRGAMEIYFESAFKTYADKYISVQ
mgnify:CR=1 FL=1